VHTENIQHVRSNTNTQLVSSNERVDQSESSDGSSFDNVGEVDSRDDNLADKQKTHVLKASLTEVEGKEIDPSKKKGANSLFRALNKRRAQSILDLNAASSRIPQQEVMNFNEALGLNEEQMDFLMNSKCLLRYNNPWKTTWDFFIMFLAVWN
jgi:hypothetical protein